MNNRGRKEDSEVKTARAVLRSPQAESAGVEISLASI